MKTTITIFSLAFCFMACQPPVDNSAQEAFEKNSETVMAYLEAWESESVDYDAFFPEDYWSQPTAFGVNDSMNLDAIKDSNMKTWPPWISENPKIWFFFRG
jgi:hypothetical protein